MSDLSIDQYKLNSDVKVVGQPNWSDKLCKKIFLSVLEHMQVGELIIEEGDQVYRFGPGGNSVKGHIFIKNISAYRQILLGGSIGAGEAYMSAEWTTPCLVSVIQVMARNMALLKRMDRGWTFLRRLTNKLMHRLNANTISGSKKNIAAHYDLGNDFFELFLDPTLMYSSAIYPDDTLFGEEDCLNQASIHKLDTICQKLNLSSDDHLLEIGTGWGGLAVHAAKNYGCRVTTTTLSKEQFNHAQKAVASAGLQDKITLLLKDYRDLEGEYDKLVSIEMIEAVGHEYYDTYFEKCSSLLKRNGLMLIQAITIADQRYQSAKHSVDFIQKYIFPGGALPSNTVVADCINRCTDMMVVDLHDIGLHYAQTLYDWRQRFHSRFDDVQQQGFDDVFCRMWDFYLAYCEGGFRERVISAAQFVFAKPDARELPAR